MWTRRCSACAWSGWPPDARRAGRRYGARRRRAGPASALLGCALALNVLSDDVSVIDLSDGRTVARVPVGKAPYGVGFDAAGRRAFVTNQHSASLSVIDLESLKVVAM